MSERAQPDLDDVLLVSEHATPDHHAHGEQSRYLNEVEHRTEQERNEVDMAEQLPDQLPSASA